MKSKLMRSDDVIWTDLADGALLVKPGAASCSLNSTAAAVWKLCDGRRSVSELARMIARPPKEISEFCRRILQLGLLRADSCHSLAHESIAPALTTTFLTGPNFKSHNLGAGPRRRPTPRGISGPA